MSASTGPVVDSASRMPAAAESILPWMALAGAVFVIGMVAASALVQKRPAAGVIALSVAVLGPMALTVAGIADHWSQACGIAHDEVESAWSEAC